MNVQYNSSFSILRLSVPSRMEYHAFGPKIGAQCSHSGIERDLEVSDGHIFVYYSLLTFDPKAWSARKTDEMASRD